MNALINFAVHRRWLILAGTLLLVAIGLYSAQKLSVDAVPDITNIQVQINTQAPGYSPLETEQRITYGIENAMSGLPKLDYTRSLSRYGLSQVTVIFEEGTDIYWARQQIAERLQQLRSDLPPGLEPELGPIASGLGEIFSYSLEAAPDARKADGSPYTLEDLRTLQDWLVRPQLMKVKGLTEINSIGGFEREYQVAPIPGKLLAYKVTLADIIRALKANNQNIGAGYIERNGEQWLVRSPGQLQSIADIEALVVTKRDDAPVRIKDLAEVSFGRELRTGAATINGRETVLGTAMMLLGANSQEVSKAVAAKLAQVNLSLPSGVSAKAVYNRSTLVDKTLSTVKTNLFEGAVLVIVVLFTLLGHLRAALIAALVIPLSMLFAITGMAANKVSGNLMSLGAIDFGLIVDGAVIVVENCLRRLSLAGKRLGRALTLEERLLEVRDATGEVLSPAVFGVMIIMLVYLPLFALQGVEGKMFEPMAFTVIFALLGALILSVTFVPAAIAILVTGPVNEKPSRLMSLAHRVYRPLLNHSMRRPGVVLAVALSLVLGAGFQASRLGSEFLPKLDEHDIALHALRIIGTDIDQSVAMQKQLELEILTLPEVARVFSKIGTPEVATDPMPPNVADTFVMLKPRSQWPDPNKPKAQFFDELYERVQSVPGNNYELTQPIEMRFNELIAGTRADVALRIYGDNLDTLSDLGERAGALLEQVPGSQSARLEQVDGLPILSIEPQRDHLALLGLTVADIQESVQTAVGGVQTGLIYEGDKRFKLLVRMSEDYRHNPELLARLPVALNSSMNEELAYVPLGEVAKIVETTGPNQIKRRDGKRNVVVTANVEGRDLGGYISDVQSLMAEQLDLPEGYYLQYGGTFEQLQSAKARLSLVVPLTLLLIFGLLYSLFNSLRDSAIVFTGIPLALTGGIVALTLRDMPFSISAAVGFIALSGISVLNGVVMLSFIRQLRDQGRDLAESVLEGAQSRLRPVLMTALVAGLGFVPMAFNIGIGAEVQRPLATVVIGGILSSTLLTLVVLPALYLITYRIIKR